MELQEAKSDAEKRSLQLQKENSELREENSRFDQFPNKKHRQLNQKIFSSTADGDGGSGDR